MQNLTGINFQNGRRMQDSNLNRGDMRRGLGGKTKRRKEGHHLTIPYSTVGRWLQAPAESCLISTWRSFPRNPERFLANLVLAARSRRFILEARSTKWPEDLINAWAHSKLAFTSLSPNHGLSVNRWSAHNIKVHIFVSLPYPPHCHA
jgi:hypothetical protein